MWDMWALRIRSYRLQLLAILSWKGGPPRAGRALTPHGGNVKRCNCSKRQPLIVQKHYVEQLLVLGKPCGNRWTLGSEDSASRSLQRVRPPPAAPLVPPAALPWLHLLQTWLQTKKVVEQLGAKTHWRSPHGRRPHLLRRLPAQDLRATPETPLRQPRHRTKWAHRMRRRRFLAPHSCLQGSVWCPPQPRWPMLMIVQTLLLGRLLLQLRAAPELPTTAKLGSHHRWQRQCGAYRSSTQTS